MNRDREDDRDVEELVNSCTSLAWSIAMKRARLGESDPMFDEFLSAAFLGLFEAARNWKKYGRKDGKFSSYAGQAMNRRITDAIRNNAPGGLSGITRNRPEIMPTVCQFYTHDDSGRDVGESFPDRYSDDDIGWELEYEDYAKSLSRILPGKDGECLELSILHAASRGAIDHGEKIGMNPNTFNSHLSRGRERLRGELNAS